MFEEREKTKEKGISMSREMSSVLNMTSLRSWWLDDSWIDKCEAYKTVLSSSYAMGSLHHLHSN